MSASQTQDEFDKFLFNFEQFLHHVVTRGSLFVLTTVDVNARAAV